MFAACLTVSGQLVAPQLLEVSTASGDTIGDKKAEARRIAVRLDALQQKSEILAENYNNAQIRLAQVRAQVSAAEACRRTHRSSDRRRRRETRSLRGQCGYTGGSAALDLVLAKDASELSARQGYAAAAIGDKADLIEALARRQVRRERNGHPAAEPRRSRPTVPRGARRRAQGHRGHGVGAATAV